MTSNGQLGYVTNYFQLHVGEWLNDCKWFIGSDSEESSCGVL
jgi:hypothetical protein